ncbi:hypothetical protein GCM10023340_26200 [Nocardioides marinquilinus]|uniref:DUF4232 domain-containing protein n=2 Tax=Nocardioides marinquilinus TaxID=1210400 RepID=A0ABP9PSL2_9ACTN
MDDATRARLRARVVAGLDESGHRRPRRWLVPAAAAAAVVVVAGVTAGVALGGDDGPSAPSGPAGSGTADVPPSDEASEAPDGPSDEPTPSDPPSDEPSSEPSSDPSSAPADPDDAVSDAEAACRPELEFILKGADVVASTTSETGSTVFFVKGGKWTACSTHGGRATVFGARALDAPDDKDAYAISSVYPKARTSTFVSAGLVPEGASRFAVGYTFPDGHRTPLTQVSDEEGRTWWSMDYTVTGGPINETNQLELDPITVEVTTDRSTQTYTLDWALDTCRQANHGC